MNIQSSSKASDEAAIRSLIDQHVKAVYAKDAAGVLACFTPDYVAFTLEPPLVSAMTGTKQYDAWFATWQGPISTEIRDLDIAVGGDIGVSRSLNRMSSRTSGGDDVEVWYRQTLSFRRLNGVWKIAHVHTSVPFYMDGSFIAATDLKP
ncbi:MAG TPA: nuclear transport factor 2 family protein [Bradyrhizobium sp.]|jgi:ketosteroid isomerase-like protein|nr:nuclear transport factor 2 family protein [Bradyrhizobium sp.]